MSWKGGFGADGVFLEDSSGEGSASDKGSDDSLIQEVELVAALIHCVEDIKD